MDWQPISSAPRDGTEILAYSEHGCTGTMLVRWTSPAEFLTDAELDEYDGETAFREDWFAADFVQGLRLSHDCHPTHWQPLPAPPEDGS